MSALRTGHRLPASPDFASAAPSARPQESKLEPGMHVVARSPDFVLRDGTNVVRVRSPFEIYRVERVDGELVRLSAEGREGDACASDLVRADDAAPYFSEQIKAHPQTAYAYLMRSHIRRGELDLANARLDCDQAIRLEPKNPWAYLMRGLIAAEQGDLRFAMADFEKTITLDDNIVEAQVGRASCHLSARDYEKALADSDEATRRDPTYVAAYVLRGRIWNEKRDPQKALHEYDEAVRLSPKSALARAARAEHYGTNQALDKALADANEAVRLDPADVAGVVYLTRARVASRMGDLDRAIADLDTAIENLPRDTDALIERADCFLERDELDKALRDANEAIRLDPKNDDALHVRAEVFLRKGEIAKAMDDLNECIELNPENLGALVTRARVQLKRGELAKALSDVDRALRIDPEDGDALDIRTAILALKHRKKRRPVSDRDAAIAKAVMLLRILFGSNVDPVANAALTAWRTFSGNENLKLRIAKRAAAHVPMTGRCVLTISSDIHSGRRVPMQIGANGLDSPSPEAAPILSIDELHLVVFIIRCARVIAFLQRFVPERYLPPKEDRIPPSLLKRLIRELKKLIPKWKWIPSARKLPRSPAKLGDELFYAITACA